MSKKSKKVKQAKRSGAAPTGDRARVGCAASNKPTAHVRQSAHVDELARHSHAMDYESLADNPAALSLVEWKVDFEAARETRWAAEESQRNPVRAAHLAERRTSPAGLNHILHVLCGLCKNPPADWLFVNDCLRQERPGAREPVERCEGCVHSYRGLIETDQSIVAAYAPRADVLANHIRDRARRFLEREQERRRRQVEAGLKAAHARAKVVGQCG